MNYNFDENEMPYGILERFGLTQAMIDDLPTDVLQNIYNGRKSPVLPVHITADDGEEVKARTRFSLVRTAEGGVDVLFYPQLDEFDLKLFNEQQEKNLVAGKPIVGHLESNEVGKELGSKCFFQLDPESKQVLSVPTPVIGRNIQYVADRYHLTGAEMQKLQNGDILTIVEDDEEQSIGIDLNSNTGIRFQATNLSGNEKPSVTGISSTLASSAVGLWMKTAISTTFQKRTTPKRCGMNRRNWECA